MIDEVCGFLINYGILWRVDYNNIKISSSKTVQYLFHIWDTDAAFKWHVELQKMLKWTAIGYGTVILPPSAFKLCFHYWHFVPIYLRNRVTPGGLAGYLCKGDDSSYMYLPSDTPSSPSRQQDQSFWQCSYWNPWTESINENDKKKIIFTLKCHN